MLLWDFNGLAFLLMRIKLELDRGYTYSYVDARYSSIIDIHGKTVCFKAKIGVLRTEFRLELFGKL